MIPKIIHYCWLSNNPIPENLKRCMDSWKKYLPDYELMLWNFDRFPKSQSKWVSDAFDNKKYAFAADYIRLYALYNYGGIYLDMDVEVLKSFDPFLNLSTMICWQNGVPGLEVAAMGVEKGSDWVKHCLDFYNTRSFVLPDGRFDTKVMPQVIEDTLKNTGINLENIQDLNSASAIEKTIPVFPCDFFSPKNCNTKQLNITHNTVCIHHFGRSWKSSATKFKKEFIRIIGPGLTKVCVKIKGLFK